MNTAVLDALRQVDLAIARRASYADLMGAVAACEALPGAEEFAAGIAQRRLTVVMCHKRQVDEVEAALLDYVSVAPTLTDRAGSTLAVCADYPELGDRYLAPIIAELEASLPDWVSARVLGSAYNLRERLAEKASQAPIPAPEPFEFASGSDPGYPIPLCGHPLTAQRAELPADRPTDRPGLARPRQLTVDEFIEIAYHVHPRIDRAFEGSRVDVLRALPEIEQQFRASKEHARMRRVQKAGYKHADSWHQLVLAVTKSLGGRRAGFLIMDATHPDLDPTFAIDIHLLNHNANRTGAKATETLSVHVSYLVPYYACSEICNRGPKNGKERNLARRPAGPDHQTTLSVVEREIAQRYGYYRLDSDVATTPVPGAYSDGHIGEGPLTLMDALFAPFRT